MRKIKSNPFSGSALLNPQSPPVICEFCDEMAFGDNNTFRLLFQYHKLSSRIVARSDNFLVFPGLGALADGYLLVIPKVHVTSFSQVKLDQYGELLQLIDNIRQVVTSATGLEVAIFEHGEASIRNETGFGCGSCIQHAHLHLCPTLADFAPQFAAHSANMYQLESLHDLGSWGNDNYLLYWGLDDRKTLYELREPVPSQALRQLWAVQMQTEKWDWALFPHLEAVKRTYNMFTVMQ